MLRSRMPATSSPICGYIMGSPPQMETMGAPHSSTAARHSSSGTRSVMVDSYSRMRPQPVQVRLQACSGSSISTMREALADHGMRLALARRSWAAGCGTGWRRPASRTAFFCHSGRGRILFLKMYPARPAVMRKWKFHSLVCSSWLGSSRTKTARAAGSSPCTGGSSR